MSTSTIIPATARLSQVRELERQIADLESRRNEAIASVVADLEWMDIPTRQIPMLYVETPVRSAPVGTRVHVLHQYQDRGEYNKRSVHLADGCDMRWCDGPKGVPVNAGGPNRWRFVCEGVFEVVGITSQSVNARAHDGEMILSQVDA